MFYPPRVDLVTTVQRCGKVPARLNGAAGKKRQREASMNRKEPSELRVTHHTHTHTVSRLARSMQIKKTHTHTHLPTIKSKRLQQTNK